MLLTLAIIVSAIANARSSKAWEIVSDENHIRFYLFTLHSPLNGTYNSRFLNLNLTFTAGMGIRYTLYYHIDGKYIDKIPFTVENSTETHVTYRAHAFTKLPELNEGAHSLIVFIICSGLIRSLPSNNGTVYFTIDSKATMPFMPQPTVDLTPPKITNLYIQNQTSNQTETPLSFIINEKTQQILYSIDGEENETIPSNAMLGVYDEATYCKMNLTGLPSGRHNITVYATDKAGNTGASKTLSFNVEQAESSYSTVTPVVIVSFTVASVIALGILVNPKRKHDEELLVEDKTPSNGCKE